MNITDTMTDTLHLVSQGILYPVIIGLILLVIASVAMIGSIIAEGFGERRRLRENIPFLISTLHETALEDMEGVIRDSKLLKRQKLTLLELFSYRDLPADELRSVAKKLISKEESHYDRILSWTEMISKIGPILGLMGTLIPLGPGITALGQGDITTLSNSIMVAFDTTVVGLLSAVICMIITKIRRRWYESYMVSIESTMECILEEVATLEHTA